MAILPSSGIYGFLCSVLKTGKQDKDGHPIYVEHFLSGFAGWGWKIWKTVAGFFRLEIDELVVRRTMTVFELFIQRIRAIKGAIAITQANGKIKTAVLSDDGTAYLITLEEDDMSFVEHDYFRCQEFNGGQKFCHVEIESVEGGAIRVPISEFEGSSLPSPGDEIVQFGNSSHDAKYAGRHSAIYMHADESGQPAIDVMFDIYSKDWTNCVKVRVGGDIPGGGGAKGFYCQNGMILSVDDNNNVVYQFSPNGGFSLGRGKIMYDPMLDKVTLKGITLSWDDIENIPDIEGGEPGKDGRYMVYQYAVNTNPSLAPTAGWTGEIPAVGKGQYLWERRGTVIPPATEPESWSQGLRVTGLDGTDANLLPWIEKWNGYATELGEEYIVTPKMFSGTKSSDGKLTGIAQGKECITIDGVKRTGIFALVDNEVVFELDPITKKYLFKGRVEANSGTFTGEVNADSGTIGGFEIANGRIGSEASASGAGGGLSITDDFLRVGGKSGYVMIGEDVIPSTTGGAFTATGRIVNNHSNPNTNWGFDTANYGLFINVSGGTRNYGIHSDAPLIASAFINTQIGYVTFGTGSYEIDFTRYSTFVINATTNISVNLPNEAALAKMFSYNSLPAGFGFAFKFISDTSSPNITFLGVINGNGDTDNIGISRGDSIEFLCYKRSSGSGISYRLVNYNS